MIDRDASPDNPQRPPAAGDASLPPVSIPDHELLRCIGRGSYGQVWLAKNPMGRFRAIKIVFRKSFDSHRPFDRELSGIRKFEPVSRSHEGFVDILHVGINEQEGYFYYVMELGDDQTAGQNIDPVNYSPKTLAREISHHGQLPLKDCVRLGVVLSDALAELHRQGLVHRDVKPSNIIFVNGVAKLADIGLVAEFSEARSYVGTEGFIPPEGPGNPQADVYGLGKALYEASTGRDRQDFPALPAEFDKSADYEAFLELNDVLLRACKDDADRRYPSAEKMHADLLGLVAGKSVKRQKLERCLTALKRIAAAAVVVIGLIAAFKHFNRERRIAITSFSPAFGVAGSSVTIVGTNFGPKLSDNLVRFGMVRAAVTGASPDKLVVRVPGGASYAPISVTARGLTACSSTPFGLTFAGGRIDPSSFGPRMDVDTGHGPYDVVIGDLDGDDVPDLVAVHTYDGSAWVLRNACTNGALTPASFDTPTILRVGGSPDGLQAVALADLDGDSRLDIVVANQGKNKISIFQNQCVPGVITSNSFSARVDIFCGSGPRDLVVRDLDGDNKPDIVTANYGGDSISILQNLGTKGRITANSFARPIELATGDATISVAVDDLDGDGKPEIAASGGAENIAIFKNIATPGKLTKDSFAPKINIPGGAESLVIGDLDGDGRPDLIAGFYLNETMSVHRNITSPGDISTNSFEPAVKFDAGGRVHHVAVADMDGDGNLDIEVVGELPDRVAIFRNISAPGSLSTNSFAPRVDFKSGWNSCGLAIGDLDGDGRPDIAFGNSYSNSVSIFRNASGLAR